MSKIYVNKCIESGGSYALKNGATKRLLLVINKTGRDIEANIPFIGRVGTLEKANTSFVFINEARPENKDDQELFVFVDSKYGVTFFNEDPIFYASSRGGYGNSKSTIAVLKKGTVIKCHSYKNRNEADFLITDDKGFTDIPLSEIMEFIRDEYSITEI